MGQYLRAIWDCRYFWMSLVGMDLRTRYRRSVLGMGWSLLQPIAMSIILCTMFSELFKMDIKTYGLFLLAGLAAWNFIVTSALGGCQCFYSGETYIRQYPAPLAIYPLRTALGAAVHFLLALAVVIVASWIFRGFGNVVALASLIPALLLYLVFGWSMAVLGGFANVRFSDTYHLAEVGFQLLFYATPIIYMEDSLRMQKMDWLLHYNPFVVILRIIREPILEAHAPSLETYWSACAIVLVVACSAMLTLVRQQRQLIFHL